MFPPKLRRVVTERLALARIRESPYTLEPMDAATIFRIANILPLPIWAIWIVAPRSEAARTLARSTWPWAVLAALYTGLVLVAFTRHALSPADFGSLAGVMKVFAA